MHWLVPTFIYLVVPAVGIFAFTRLCRRLRAEKIPEPPDLGWFFLFLAYGNWLVAGLAAMASLDSIAGNVIFLLVLIFSVFALPITAILLGKQRRQSPYHAAVFWGSAIYLPFTILLVLAL